MRHALSIAVVTFAVAVPAGIASRPAFAATARESADQQPLLLAQNSSGGPNMFSLLQDIQRLQDQVRELRGEVDTLKYQLRQNEQGQRDLYQNLDKRMSTLESGGSGSSGGSGFDSSSSSGNAGGGSSQDQDFGGNEYGAEDDSRGGYGSGASGGADGGSDAEVQSQYMAAFDKLKNGQYDAAISGFKGFLGQHPESAYSDNAWYWLGEANYVQRNYDASLKAFQTVVNRFKASSKVAGSLYKIGVIQDEQGQTDNAKGTLQRVVDQYPNDNAAELARKRLQAIGN